MKKDQESFDKLEELITGIGAKPLDYSGRGMDGVECLAFQTDQRPFDMAADLVEATQGDLELIEELAAAFREMRSDSMGMRTIYYFPNYQKKIA